jgi:hypothetical protein
MCQGPVKILSNKIDLSENEQNYFSTSINSYSTLKNAKIIDNLFYQDFEDENHRVSPDHAIYLRGSQGIQVVGNHFRGLHNGPAGGINLKSDKWNYLQKVKTAHSERELLGLIKTAKVRNEDNIKADKILKEQAIKRNKGKSNESKTSGSKLQNEKSSETPASSVPSSSQEQGSQGRISISSQDIPATSTLPLLQHTDGLNFNGKHYDIISFTGLGHVPVDGYIYQWADYTEHLHLLAERQSPIGRDVRELAIGSTIIVNNQTYTIYNILTGVINDQNAYNSLSNGHPAITIQSCDSEEKNSTLTFWYAS